MESALMFVIFVVDNPGMFVSIYLCYSSENDIIIFIQPRHFCIPTLFIVYYLLIILSSLYRKQYLLMLLFYNMCNLYSEVTAQRKNGPIKQVTF